MQNNTRVTLSRIGVACVMGAIFLTGCSSSDDKKPLPGDRIPVIQFNDTASIDSGAKDMPWQLAPEAANTAWPQPGGAASHVPGQVALGQDALKKAWSVSIGNGSRKNTKLITTPVVADNKVFAADSEGEVSAYQLDNGKRLWRVNVLGKNDMAVVSPGLTYGGRVLFVSDGLGDVLALNPQDGTQLWKRDLGQPVRGAPTYLDGRLYVIALNDETLALDARNGELLWRHSGVQEAAGLLGAPSPAAEGSVVVTAYSSGDIVALRAETGQEAWTDNLSNSADLANRAVTQLSGFRGHPVLDQEIVIAGNSSSRLVAVHVPSGERIWQKEFGITGTPWISGNSVFVMTAQNALVALTRDEGFVRWTTSLPRFEDKDREDPIFWNGPIMAGGRLLLTGSNERLLEIDPVTGKQQRATELPDRVMLPPIVAQKTLIIVTDDGDMVAYR